MNLSLSLPAAPDKLGRRGWLQSALGSGAGLSAMAALGLLQACGGSDAHAGPVFSNATGFPAFFDQAPVLRMHDALAQFLGAAEGGFIEYRYVDAVRLAGHSCPTVAGSYLMVLKGLAALHGADTPERGGIEVFMRDGPEEGVTGVIAAVTTLLTGAASAGGFPGMGAARRFGRKNLLRYQTDGLSGVLALRRRDTGQAVQVGIDHELIPWTDEMKALMPKAIGGQATPEELQRFAWLWQERVKQMLVEHADDPKLVQVNLWSPA